MINDAHVYECLRGAFIQMVMLVIIPKVGIKPRVKVSITLKSTI